MEENDLVRLIREVAQIPRLGGCREEPSLNMRTFADSTYGLVMKEKEWKRKCALPGIVDVCSGPWRSIPGPLYSPLANALLADCADFKSNLPSLADSERKCLLRSSFQCGN